MEFELGFIGAGNMAEAIAKSAMAAQALGAGQMIASDTADPRKKIFADMGVTIAQTNAEVIRRSKQVLLAVKPQMFPQVAADLAGNLTPEHVIITIMAGLSSVKITAAVKARLEESAAATSNLRSDGLSLRIIRVMPNTPLMIGQGMAGIAPGVGAKPGDEALALKLFSAGGKAVVLPESQIDALTSVSGSGPAYVFYLAEAMEKAAAELGLGEHARAMVRQTILGSALLMNQSSDPPAELRRKVTSPGGTTEAAIKHLEGNATTAVIVNAIKAAHRRAGELGA